MLELCVYREKDRQKIGDAYENGRRNLNIVKKKGNKGINNIIRGDLCNIFRGDLWDQARGDTITRKKKCDLEGTTILLLREERLVLIEKYFYVKDTSRIYGLENRHSTNSF